VKGWTPGTAVSWDGDFWEVLSAESEGNGIERHVLVPWNDREVLRGFVTYEDASAELRRLSGKGPRTGAAAANAGFRRFVLLAATAAAAFLLGGFFPLSIITFGITALAHELGHTVMSLFFGRFAMPTPIMTFVAEQTLASVLAVWALLLLALWRFRRFPAFSIPFGVLCAVYPFLARSPIHDSFITLAGHGAEVGAAAFLLARAARAVLEREWERPGWALLGWLILRNDLSLGWRLARSAEARTDYMTISWVGDNDFVRIANVYGLSLERIGGVFFFVALAVPAVALFWRLLRPREGA
jgi:hypothetical protein